MLEAKTLEHHFAYDRQHLTTSRLGSTRCSKLGYSGAVKDNDAELEIGEVSSNPSLVSYIH